MSKVVLKINAKYYQDLAKEALDNNDLSTALRHYRAALSLDNLTKDERLTIKKEYAKTLALRGKFSYSACDLERRRIWCGRMAHRYLHLQ